MKNQPLDRKDFLRIVAAAGVAGLTGKLAWDASRVPALVQETRLLMGTIVNLTVIGEDQQFAQSAVDSCFTRMKQLEALLSRYQPQSQLSRLNRTGEISSPSRALVEIIQQSRIISTASGGKFDITVKPLLDLYQQHQQEHMELPSQAALEETLALVDYRQISLDENRISLAQKGMALTLDGIAKGYIVDAGVDTLNEHGFGNVLVEAGGDLGAFGQKGPDRPWQIGIRSPREDKEIHLPTLVVHNRSLATSGDYLHSFTPDHSQHHILDPQRGVSSPELASVSVLAPSALQADGYATAVMVMGLEEGRSMIERLPEVEALMITKNLESQETTGFETFHAQAA